MNGIVTGKVEKPSSVGWEQTEQFLANNIVDTSYTMDLTDYGNSIVPHLSEKNFCVKIVLYTAGQESYIWIRSLVRTFNNSFFIPTNNSSGIFLELRPDRNDLVISTNDGLSISKNVYIIAFGFLRV